LWSYQDKMLNNKEYKNLTSNPKNISKQEALNIILNDSNNEKLLS